MLSDVRGVVAPIAALRVPPSSRAAGYPDGSTRVQPAAGNSAVTRSAFFAVTLLGLAGLVAYAARAFRAATAVSG